MKAVGGGAIADGTTDAKNAHGNDPLMKFKTTPKGFFEQLLSISEPSQTQSALNYPKCQYFLSPWLKKGKPFHRKRPTPLQPP
jgi:hypothetical protein